MSNIFHTSTASLVRWNISAFRVSFELSMYVSPVRVQVLLYSAVCLGVKQLKLLLVYGLQVMNLYTRCLRWSGQVLYSSRLSYLTECEGRLKMSGLR